MAASTVRDVGAWSADLVLFNGGFFTPAAARERVVQALTDVVRRAAPMVLAASNLEAAVAIGAATYARLRAGIGPSMSLVKAGSGRAILHRPSRAAHE